MELVAVIQIALQPAWYELESYERERLRRDLFQHLGADNSVRFRWFDADAWTGSGAEFLVCEFSALSDYWNFWSSLREHRFFRRGYAQFGRVSLGYERPLSVGLVET